MLKVDISEVEKNLKNIDAKTLAGLKLYGEVSAAKMAAEAKHNAPWTDRTGLARKRIDGYSQFEKLKLLIGLRGNMEYSPQLELGFEKRFAILYPTITRNANAVLQGIGKIIQK